MHLVHNDGMLQATVSWWATQTKHVDHRIQRDVQCCSLLVAASCSAGPRFEDLKRLVIFELQLVAYPSVATHHGSVMVSP